MQTCIVFAHLKIYCVFTFGIPVSHASFLNFTKTIMCLSICVNIISHCDTKLNLTTLLNNLSGGRQIVPRYVIKRFVEGNRSSRGHHLQIVNRRLLGKYSSSMPSRSKVVVVYFPGEAPPGVSK